MLHPNFTSEEVKTHYEKVKFVNDFYNGVDTASTYIIQYSGESDTDYKKRLALRKLSNYTKKAVTSIRDIIYRKPIDMSEIESSPLAPYMETIDYQNNLTNFAKQLTVSAARDGHTYLLVEKEPYLDVQTRADELAKRPYFVNVQRQMIRNYKMDEMGNFTMITYDESYIAEAGTYSQSIKTQQRVYFDDGRVEIWRQSGKRNYMHESYDTGLNFIPIIKIGRDAIPPFYDLARINMNHMNLSSEQRYYARIAAYPTPVVYMPNSNETGLKVGVTNGISFSSPRNESGFEWVELSGHSNEILASLIQHDEEDMRSYLAELVSDGIQKTAKEVSIQNTDNESKLGYYAEIVEEGINKAFKIMAFYQGVQNFDSKIYINRDYFDKRLSDQEVTAYKGLYTDGVISWDKLLVLLQEGEILPTMTKEDLQLEKALINNNMV